MKRFVRGALCLLMLTSCRFTETNSPQSKPASPASPKPSTSPLSATPVESVKPTPFARSEPTQVPSPSVPNGGTLTIVKLAGTGERKFQDGLALEASFTGPNRPCEDASGKLYIPDLTRIRTLSIDGKVSTLGGSSASGYRDGPVQQALFDRLGDCVVDENNNVYLIEIYLRRIRKLTPEGIVSTLSGTGERGSADGPGETATYTRMNSMAYDAPKKRILITDQNLLREVNPETGEVHTLFANIKPGYQDGSLETAQFGETLGITFDPLHQIIFISDETDNHGQGFTRRTIRQIKDGQVSTLAGGDNIDNLDGKGDKSYFSEISAMAFDSKRNILYIADGPSIRVVTPTGVVRTLKLPGQIGYRLKGPFEGISSLMLDQQGNLIVQESIRLQKVILPPTVEQLPTYIAALSP